MSSTIQIGTPNISSAPPIIIPIITPTMDQESEKLPLRALPKFISENSRPKYGKKKDHRTPMILPMVTPSF